MRPDGLSSMRIVPVATAVLSVLSLALLTPTNPSAAQVKAAPAPAVKTAAPSAAKPAAHRRWRRRYYAYRRYRRPATTVAAAKPGVPAPKAVAVAQKRPTAPHVYQTAMAHAPTSPYLAVKPMLVASRSVAPKAAIPATTISASAVVAPGKPALTAAQKPVVHRYWRRRYSRRRVANPAINTAAMLASPKITPSGNLVEPLSNGLTFSLPRVLVQARYGKPQEQVGQQIRYTNFGMEYVPGSQDKVNLVALQHDVRLNSKIGTGSTRDEVEKVFGNLNQHNEAVYQKYLLRFTFTPEGTVDVITVSPAPGRPTF